MKPHNPVMLGVAPNGARKTHADHPALPITHKEIATTANACIEAGAVMLHLHVRDRDQGHSLDPEIYTQATKTIRREVGDSMIIQITTEAVGMYKPEEQIECVKKVNPEAVSIAIRELIPDPENDIMAGKFFDWLYKERIAPQFILYSAEDVEHFCQLHQRGLIQSDSPNILLVLGKYTEHQESDPADIEPLLKQIKDEWHWWLCAFGSSESDCMARAMSLGGHCRIGFENNLLADDGWPATDNASQIATSAQLAATLDRGLATASQARELMNIR